MFHIFPKSQRIRRALGQGPLLGVIGSTSCHHVNAPEACNRLGTWLATTSYSVVTGGLPGIPKAVCDGLAVSERIFHLLPFFWPRPAVGKTIRTGLTLYGRRVRLAEVCDIYLCIEGGPGTAHEARLVNARKLPLIPLGAFGGHAAREYRDMARPQWVQESDWHDIGDSDGGLHQSIGAAMRILQAFELAYNKSVNVRTGNGSMTSDCDSLWSRS